MNYVIEEMAKTLKATRERQGLSQRELSLRSGVPQSHISKIESGAVDLRVSSLIGLARELGLELTLVPRKTVPAVNSIVRNNERQMERASNSGSTKAGAELKNIDEVLKLRLKNLASHTDLSATAKLKQQIREIQRFKVPFEELDKIRSIKKSIESMEDTAGLRKAIAEVDSLRNALAHANVYKGIEPFPRSAYSLEGDDDA